MTFAESATAQRPDVAEPGWLAALPRVDLGYLPTPLVPLDRLSAALGGPRIWLKRDDCTGLATGGNKTRKLEYLLAAARAAGADSVVTFGALQSNHARQTAAACARVGLPCHLLLSRRVNWHPADNEDSGNILLDDLLGATIEKVDPAEVPAATANLLARLRASGHAPCIIPVGGSNATGALGYVRCAHELGVQSREQDFRLTDVFHATSSGGTQAGLVAGFAALTAPGGQRPRVIGINVYEPDTPRLHEIVLALSRDTLEVIRTAREQLDPACPIPMSTDISATDIHIDSRHLGPDYGIPTPATLAAIRRLARTEGVLLDPVYSGKGFAGLLHAIEQGELADRRDVVFIHTGGTAVLPVYREAFSGPATTT